MATPFVEGRLRNTLLTVTIDSECAHSATHIRIAVDSPMTCRAEGDAATALVFEPEVNWETFTESNIIRAY
jgi:hypothetical protein